MSGEKIISDFVKTLPGKPGVYRMMNKDGDVLYVGKARNLKKRVTSYTTMKKHPVRLQRMIFETTAMEFITTHTEAEALLLEATGTLFGESFGQNDYFSLGHMPAHHNLGGAHLIKFDTPIQGHCGLIITAIGLGVDPQVTPRVFTLTCDWSLDTALSNVSAERL